MFCNNADYYYYLIQNHGVLSDLFFFLIQVNPQYT